MTRAAELRCVPFTVPQDPRTAPTYQAWCVSGDGRECGADSAEWITPHRKSSTCRFPLRCRKLLNSAGLCVRTPVLEIK